MKFTSILDYGAGGGYIANALCENENDNVYAYEPIEEMFHVLQNNKNNKIICINTLSGINNKIDLMIVNSVSQCFQRRFVF